MHFISKLMNLVILPNDSRTDVALESLKSRIGPACLLQHFQEKPAHALSTPEFTHFLTNVNGPIRNTFIVLYWNQSEKVLDWKNVSLHLWRSRGWTHISFWQENRTYSKVACVAWRFSLGALSNKGGRGQRNREEIGAEATWKTACTDGGLFWVGPHASVRIVPIGSKCSPVNQTFW